MTILALYYSNLLFFVSEQKLCIFLEIDPERQVVIPALDENLEIVQLRNYPSYT